MSFSERIKKIISDCRERGENMPESTFGYDMNQYAEHRYAELEYPERLARSMADAIRNQKIYIYPEDRIIGRIYHLNEKKVESPCLCVPLSLNRRLDLPEGKRLLEKYPCYRELYDNRLIPGVTGGHIAWDYNRILGNGTEAMKKECLDCIGKTDDKKAIEFYNGVIIMLTALEDWNDLHAERLEEMGMHETAKICRRVPRYSAETFREAVQAFYMQHIVVMAENPFGGNSPGRLDYYLWPYLERDLRLGRCTEDEARELIAELFLRIDERIHGKDTWVEAVVVGGVTPSGASAVNPLSYMMIEVISELNITHPSVYVRLSENAPEDFVKLCGEYFIKGGNRAQLLNDDSIIKALTASGVSYNDAADYFCGGCMEIGIQGRTADFLYNGYFNTVKLVELAVTGGFCLKNRVRLGGVNFSGLESFDSFGDFYKEYISETNRLLDIAFEALDLFAQRLEDGLELDGVALRQVAALCLEGLGGEVGELLLQGLDGRGERLLLLAEDALDHLVLLAQGAGVLRVAVGQEARGALGRRRVRPLPGRQEKGHGGEERQGHGRQAAQREEKESFGNHACASAPFGVRLFRGSPRRALYHFPGDGSAPLMTVPLPMAWARFSSHTLLPFGDVEAFHTIKQVYPFFGITPRPRGDMV